MFLTGLYVLAVPVFLVAALILAGLSDPRVPYLGRAAEIFARSSDTPDVAGTLASALRVAPARVALLVLAAANLVMVAIMAVAPLEMTHHGHDLGFVGLAVSLHVMSMFAPSPVTGWVADRAGSASVAGGGAVLLVVAGLVGMSIDPASGWEAVVFLVVVGLGWNCGVVGGSSLLVATVPAEARHLSEGAGEVSMGLAAAAGASAAGPIIALGGFVALGITGSLVGAITLAGIRAGITSGRPRPRVQAKLRD